MSLETMNQITDEIHFTFV